MTNLTNLLDISSGLKLDFRTFCELGLKMQWGQHMDEWESLIENNDRLLIECQRGGGKSWFISRAFILWLIYRDHIPQEILLVSYSEEQSVDLMRKIEAEILHNPIFSHLRPKADSTWQTTLFTFPNGTRVKAVGFGSSVRGQHPDWIIVDDPLKDSGALEPEKQYDYFMGALSGTAKKNTKILVIGTPLDPGDLLSRLEVNPAYTFRAYPAYSVHGEPLFPYLFDKVALEKRRKEVGSLVFAREYLLQRIDPETQVFKDTYKTVNDEIKFPRFIAVRTLVDPAISEKEAACETAVTTWGIDEVNNFWELDTRLLQSDNSNGILKEVVKSCELFMHYSDYAIVFEGELFQKILAFNFRQLCNERGIDARVIEVTHQGTLGKHQRIQGLQPAWEARAIHLLPESDLAKQFAEYRPRAKNIRVDAIDAFAWIRDERVCVPFVHSIPVIGEVPNEARGEE